LANTGQLAVVEMDFRVQDRGVAIAPEPAVPDDESQPLTKTFDYDAILRSIREPKTPFNPLAAVRKLPDSNKPITSLRPEHLRALAEAAAQMHARTEAIRSASTATEHQADLALAESTRQLRRLREAANGMEAVRARAAANADRTAAMAAKQASLSTRLDAVLNALLAEYRPEIGAVERKWFDELERLRARVHGSNARRASAQGLVHKAQVLREQLAVVRPLAKDLKAETEGQYGTKQLRPLRAALDERSDELSRMMRKMEALAVRVGDEEGEEDDA
jgi:nucleoporin NUP82